LSSRRKSLKKACARDTHTIIIVAADDGEFHALHRPSTRAATRFIASRVANSPSNAALARTTRRQHNQRTIKMSLSGKTVLVFGGSSGMGKAAAKTVLKL